jgi:TonB family protein
VTGVAYEDDRPRTKWLVPELEQLQAQIDRTLRGKDNRILNMSRDQNVVLLWSGGADDPGTYYVFDRAARRMNIFASPYDRLDGARFSPVKSVRYAARDGLSIPAYLTLPQGREAKGLPLIVLPHGGPFIRDSHAFHPWVQFLADRGYAVLQPNYRGSTGYGRTYVERGYGEWGRKMQDDLDDGVAWLEEAGTIDPKRVCIMGASYGGYAALWGAIRNPELYRCAISLAGVTDVGGMLKYDSKFLIAKRYSKQWRKKVVGEQSRDLAAVSPLQQAARLNVPVLIAHGERDTNVPVDQGRKMVAALKARGAPVQSAFYPGEGHSFHRAEDSIDFLRRVEAFLEIHNPAAPAAPAAAAEPRLVSGAIGNDDLPLAERKKKDKREVGIRFLVTADGRVTRCAVSRASGSSALDSLACKLAEERFQYRPARDAAGERREAWLDHVITWQISA